MSLKNQDRSHRRRRGHVRFDTAADALAVTALQDRVRDLELQHRLDRDRIVELQEGAAALDVSRSLINVQA